jgi:hypothetical protein
MNLDDLIFLVMNQVRKSLNEELAAATEELGKANEAVDAAGGEGKEGASETKGTSGVDKPKAAGESEGGSASDKAKNAREDAQEKLQQLVKKKDQFMTALTNTLQAMHQTTKAGINNIRV